MDAIRPAALRQAIGSDHPPLVIDVRRAEGFKDSGFLIAGALRRDPERVEEWAKTLPSSAAVVVYCVHGHEVSQAVAKALGAKYLEGGIEAWRETGGELFHKPINSSSRWVTRERPKIDRIACPWLIRRFIDPESEFFYVPTPDVRKTAELKSAVPSTCRRTPRCASSRSSCAAQIRIVSISRRRRPALPRSRSGYPASIKPIKKCLSTALSATTRT